MSISTKLHNETKKSGLLHQHAAIITKNSKRPVASKHNTSRSKYFLNNDAVLTCSMHAEIGVLHHVLKRVLKASNKRSCVLRRS